jgi:hypothetical protein
MNSISDILTDLKMNRKLISPVEQFKVRGIRKEYSAFLNSEELSLE